MSTEHLIRTLATLLAFFTILLAYIYLAATETAPALAGRLEGMLAVLTPAVYDTLRVGKRERIQQRNSAHDEIASRVARPPGELTEGDVAQLRE